MRLAPGTRLGNYDIVGSLGAGGMGEVYRATDRRLGRQVALKVLPAGVATHADRLARFEREARTIASLNHPNIVVLYSIEDADETRFLTMELIEGDSLDRCVTAGGLASGRVVEVGIALADALVAAHEQGVVHRDLKPANVMVSRDGRIKVLDFGLAKAATPNEQVEMTQMATAAAPLSGVGLVVGTVPYMAPEQVRGEAVDARTDLFALGVMLYELCAGRRPFTGSSPSDVQSAILRDTPPPLSTVRTDVQPDLARIIERCLEKQPRARFQTALDVCNELRRLASGLHTRPPAPRGGESASIAVLPFVNRSREEEDEYFADGLTDELLGVLAKIRGLRVAARSSSFTFKGRSVTVAEVGQTLNVATVLEGSVRKAGSRVRIAVQLVKVADGYHLWSDTYDRTLDDIFAVQDDIAQSVVKELRTALLGEQQDSRASGEARAEVAAAARGRGTDPEAHRLYLQGRFFAERMSKDDYERAAVCLQEALALDPGHALAWTQLSRTRLMQAGLGFAPMDTANAEARTAAERALALEPDLPEAHVAIAGYEVWHGWNWGRAQEAVSRALELAPGLGDALLVAAVLSYALGRLDDALAYARRSVEMSPLDAGGYLHLGRSYIAARMPAEAERAMRKGLELSPKSASTRGILSTSLLEQGRFDEALALVREEPLEWGRQYGLAMAYAAMGRIEESDEHLLTMVRDHPDTLAYQIASIYARRGDAERTFEWLEHAYRTRDSGLVVMQLSTSFRSVHDDPRWDAFLRKLGVRA
ncbi:MAG: protein kinase [Vicinamibacterales bacterium]